MMKILVIGATGGTGCCVVESALQAGHEVTAFVRTPQKFTLQHEQLRVVQGDMQQPDSVLRAMQGQEAVICALGPAAGTAPGTIISDGVRNIVQAMQQERVRRFVFESGIMVGEANGLNPANIGRRLRADGAEFRFRASSREAERQPGANLSPTALRRNGS